MMQKLIEQKGQMEKSMIIVEILTPPSVLDRISRQKISKAIGDSNHTITHLKIDVYRTLHPRTTEHAFFLNVPGTLSG